MELFVKEMPKNCAECSLCIEFKTGNKSRNKNGVFIENIGKKCCLGDGLKYQTIDDEIDTCPLKLVKCECEELKQQLETRATNLRIINGERMQLKEENEFLTKALEIKNEMKKINSDTLESLTRFEIENKELKKELAVAERALIVMYEEFINNGVEEVNKKALVSEFIKGGNLLSYFYEKATAELKAEKGEGNG